MACIYDEMGHEHLHCAEYEQEAEQSFLEAFDKNVCLGLHNSQNKRSLLTMQLMLWVIRDSHEKTIFLDSFVCRVR